jgi:hypothetical protein
MYAPVVSFPTYAVEVGAARACMDAAVAFRLGAMAHGGMAEPCVLPEDEVDWPTVMRI